MAELQNLRSRVLESAVEPVVTEGVLDAFSRKTHLEVIGRDDFAEVFVSMEVGQRCVESEDSRLEKDLAKFSGGLPVSSVDLDKVGVPDFASRAEGVQGRTVRDRVRRQTDVRAVFVLARDGESGTLVRSVLLRATE